MTRDTASPDAAAGGAPEQVLPPDRELQGGRQSPAQPRLPDQLQRRDGRGVGPRPGQLLLPRPRHPRHQRRHHARLPPGPNVCRAWWIFSHIMWQTFPISLAQKRLKATQSWNISPPVVS